MSGAIDIQSCKLLILSFGSWKSVIMATKDLISLARVYFWSFELIATFSKRLLSCWTTASGAFNVRSQNALISLTFKFAIICYNGYPRPTIFCQSVFFWCICCIFTTRQRLLQDWTTMSGEIYVQSHVTLMFCLLEARNLWYRTQICLIFFAIVYFFGVLGS